MGEPTVGLIAFLNARLDEDEAVAGALCHEDWGDRPWAVTECSDKAAGECPCIVYQGEYKPFDEPQAPLISYIADAESPPIAAHIARYDPAWILREVAAKRALIRDLLDSRHFLNDREWYGCEAVTDGPIDSPDVPTGRECTCGRDDDVERRLRILAAVYSDHPDYQQKWKP